MALLQAIRYHVHRLAKIESGRPESDALNEMESEDQHLEDELKSLRRGVSVLQEFKRSHEERIQQLEASVSELEAIARREVGARLPDGTGRIAGGQ